MLGAGIGKRAAGYGVQASKAALWMGSRGMKGSKGARLGAVMSRTAGRPAMSRTYNMASRAATRRGYAAMGGAGVIGLGMTGRASGSAGLQGRSSGGYAV